MTFVSGANFSGRSEWLRDAARAADGVYVHPDLELNLSGLAETVAGERFLHGLAQDADGYGRRRLSTLSGGQRASLVIGCALGSGAPALAIDCALVQLDRGLREGILRELAAFADTRPVWLADNRINPGSFADAAGPRPATDAGKQFNAALNRAIAIIRPHAGAPCVRLVGLSFRYPGAADDIFTDCDFTMRPGRVHLLKAPNGAGKSTLARLLVGVLLPTAGRIEIDGAQPHRGVRPFFYAFQNPRDQIFGRTVYRYLADVERFGITRSASWPVEWGNVPSVCEAFGLAPFGDAEVWDLPPLALKRLGLAAAFASRAPWLFLDEPALGLDHNGREMLAGLLSIAAAQGRGIVAVSHGDEFDDIPGAVGLTIEAGALRREQS